MVENNDNSFKLIAAYIFKWHPNQAPSIICKIQSEGFKENEWNKTARTHAYETRPIKDNFNQKINKKIPAVNCFSMTLPDRIVVSVVCGKKYGEETAWKFLSQCYIDFRERVPDPNSKYDRETKDDN